MPEAARNNHTICDPMFMQQKRNGILWSAVFNTDAHTGIIPCRTGNKNLCNSQSNDSAPRPEKLYETAASERGPSPTASDLTSSYMHLVGKSHLIHFSKQTGLGGKNALNNKKVSEKIKIQIKKNCHIYWMAKNRLKINGAG